MMERAAAVQAGWKLENTYAELPEVFYTRWNPTPVRAPKLIVFNERLAAELGLNAEALQSEHAVALFAGNELPEGAEPLAQAYAGHQFGHFTMLGDGRAILLGEQVTPQGERFDIQLKGPGQTPYSRRGDGRAAVGPMLREYIISEAMHALGIPTTRSLAVTATGEPVFRETTLPGAVLTRTAASHLRVGTFQYAASFCSPDELRALAEYTIQRHYPHIEGDGGQRYLSLLREVMQRQASLIAKWMHVGFIHGVMNTDNMALSGETIDYGPCAFMDAYDPATVFSSIDRQGRYAYGNQPPIAGWNLARLAEALLPLLHADEDRAVELAEQELAGFNDMYRSHYVTGMRAKLGLFGEEQEDEALADGLLSLMKQFGADYTNTFRSLTVESYDDKVMFESAEFKLWQDQWNARRGRQQESHEASQQLMRSANPAVIPRNHRVEEALEAAQQEDYSVMHNLLAALSNPYDYNEERADYCKLPDEGGRPYRTYCGT